MVNARLAKLNDEVKIVHDFATECLRLFVAQMVKPTRTAVSYNKLLVVNQILNYLKFQTANALLLRKFQLRNSSSQRQFQ
jgi:hypothetical protein